MGWGVGGWGGGRSGGPQFRVSSKEFVECTEFDGRNLRAVAEPSM